MTIRDALKKMKKKQTITSVQCEMYEQKRKDLLYWFFIEDEVRNDFERKSALLKLILEATDWEIDTEERND